MVNCVNSLRGRWKELATSGARGTERCWRGAGEIKIEFGTKVEREGNTQKRWPREA